MKYFKIIILIITTMSGVQLSAQVTIGSGDRPHDGAVLELKSDNKGFLGPRVQLESISSPNPIEDPAVGLLVFNIGDNGIDDEKVLKDRLYFWSGNGWIEFIYEEVLEAEINNVIKNLGIPRAAVFHLNGRDSIDYRNPSAPVLGMHDVMKDAGLGAKRWLYYKETDNETEGDVQLVIDTKENSYLRFKKGTYSIIFAYQFIPSTYAFRNPSTPVSECTASSYFVDFPLEKSGVTGDRARIHNVAYHAKSGNSHHGGSISYVIKIEQDDMLWEMKLGAGQSGSNCNYNSTLAIPGFSLMNDNTFVLVQRIGD